MHDKVLMGRTRSRGKGGSVYIVAPCYFLIQWPFSEIIPNYFKASEELLGVKFTWSAGKIRNQLMCPGEGNYI